MSLTHSALLLRLKMVFSPPPSSPLPFLLFADTATLGSGASPASTTTTISRSPSSAAANGSGSLFTAAVPVHGVAAFLVSVVTLDGSNAGKTAQEVCGI